MLNNIPDELLFGVAKFSARQDLLRITQVSRRYRRFLKKESDRKRYAAVFVESEHGLVHSDKEWCKDFRIIALPYVKGPICVVHIDKLMQEPELVRTMRKYCKALYPVCPFWRELPPAQRPTNAEYKRQLCELTLTLAMMFAGSSVIWFDTWCIDVWSIGYGFPEMDRKTVASMWPRERGEGSEWRWLGWHSFGPLPVDPEAERQFVQLFAQSQPLWRYRMHITTPMSENRSPFLSTVRKLLNDENLIVRLFPWVNGVEWRPNAVETAGNQ